MNDTLDPKKLLKFVDAVKQDKTPATPMKLDLDDVCAYHRELVRRFGIRPMRFKGLEQPALVLDPKETILGIDLAKPGSDMTVVHQVVLGPDGPALRYIPLQEFYFSRSLALDDFDVLTPRPPRLRKSQRSTQRRLRFERNKAKRLAAARKDRAFVRIFHRPRRAGLNTLARLRENHRKELNRLGGKAFDRELWNILTGTHEAQNP